MVVVTCVVLTRRLHVMAMDHCLPSTQAYFFTEPLPAHHSELPVPDAARGDMPGHHADDIPLHHIAGFTPTPLVHPRALPL